MAQALEGERLDLRTLGLLNTAPTLECMCLLPERDLAPRVTSHVLH